jgi:hypothetical protein
MFCVRVYSGIFACRPFTSDCLNPDDDASYVSLGLALITLSPILLMVNILPLYKQKLTMWSGIIRSIGGSNARVSCDYNVGRSVFRRTLELGHKAYHQREETDRCVSVNSRNEQTAYFFSTERIGNGYAFPSSHSQYMAYFSSFLICHLYFRHRFSRTGYPVVDTIWRLALYVALLLWPGLVAYSR